VFQQNRVFNKNAVNNTNGKHFDRCRNYRYFL